MKYLITNWEIKASSEQKRTQGQNKNLERLKSHFSLFCSISTANNFKEHWVCDSLSFMREGRTVHFLLKGKKFVGHGLRICIFNTKWHDRFCMFCFRYDSLPHTNIYDVWSLRLLEKFGVFDFVFGF